MTPLVWRGDTLFWGPFKVGSVELVRLRWWPSAGGRLVRGDLGHLSEAVARQVAEQAAGSIIAALLAGTDEAGVELCAKPVWYHACRFPARHSGECG